MTKEYATIGPIDPESGFASVHIGAAHVADAMLDGAGSFRVALCGAVNPFARGRSGMRLASHIRIEQRVIAAQRQRFSR